MTDHGIFYPQALYYDLVFELTLAPANQVVRGSDPTKLEYKLTNIQLEYEWFEAKSLQMRQNQFTTLANSFLYHYMNHDTVVAIDKGTARE